MPTVNLERGQRRLRLNELQRIIYKRFGSLTDIGPPIRGYAEIGRLLRIPSWTVRQVVLRFLERGSRIDRLAADPRRRFKMLSEELQQTLLSKPLLLKWAAYSLLERVHTIKREWNVSLAANSLFHFYKEHNVAWAAAKTVYRKAIETRAELDPRRLKIAALLANMIADGKPLVYMDESR